MIERLAAYAAVDRLHALAAGRDLADRTSGSALSVDISGFSALTEGLARRLGARGGAEELTRHLNAVYQALVSEVHCHGGSVVGFAGDGFTAWIDEGRGRPEARAVACGLAIQERFASETAGDGVRSALALRVAVTSGPVRRFAVGDPAVHRLDVLAGETMTRLAAADALARPGEVVVDEATARAPALGLEGGDGRTDEAGRDYLVARALTTPVDPAPWPPLPTRLRVEDLRPWHLPPLWERLRAGQADFLTELRPAAALFLGFEGLDYDGDPQAGERLEGFVRRVQAILARYEGTLVQLTIGDKGSYLYAAFGAPVAHDDDPFRAVRAAVRLTRSAAEAPVGGLRIGVSHGMMRVGAYGGTARRTYGVLGDEVNLAARLMQKAEPGQPLFSERIRRATHDVVRWKALPPIRIKGRDEAVPVFAVLGGKGAVGREPAAIAGREDERTALVWSLEALAEGRSGLLVLEGDPGLGKSRLVVELTAEARRRGLAVATGAGDALERSRPYHAWRQVLATLLDVSEEGMGRGASPHTMALGRTTHTRLALGVSRQREPLSEADTARLHTLVAAAAPDLAVVTPLLNAVLSREMPETDWTRSMEAPVRAASTLDLLAALVRHSAGRSPLVVVLEDGQWLDSASWALAARVARAPGLLLVIATRPFDETVPQDYADLCQAPDTTVARLGPLAPEAVAAVAARALGAERLSRAVASLLQGRAEGSPLLALELARSLREAGLVDVRQGEATLSPDAPPGHPTLPDGVEGIVLGRVDRLPPLAQRVVKVASVIGRRFTLGCLRHVLEAVEGSGVEQRLLAPALVALEKAGLVEDVSADEESAWVFSSGVVQQIVYELMGSDQRRGLHSAVAEYHEGEASEATELALLAHHWLQAGRALQAQPYLEQAAEAALRAGAWAEAGRLYGQLLDTDDDRGRDEDRRRRRAGWQTRFAVAEAGAGRVGEARQHVVVALDLLGRRTGGSLAGAAVASGARDLVLRRLVPAPVQRATMVEAAQAYERLAELHYLSDEPMSGLREALRGLALALRTGQTDVRARLQSAIALALGVVPLHVVSKPLMRGALEVARGLDDPATAGLVLEFAALHAFALGRWEEARGHIHEALSRYESLGDRHRTLELRSTLAAVAYTRGQFAAAGALFADLAQDAAAVGNTRARSWAELGHALVAFRTGDTARGLALLGSRRAATLQPLARLHLGEPREALEALPAALALARGRPIKCWTLERFALPAEVALALREADLDLTGAERARLARLEREALRAARRFARVFPIGAPREAHLRGLSHWLDGRPGRARRAWEEALAAAQRLEMPWDEARVSLDLGRHGVNGSTEQADHLDRAATLLEELGAFDDRDDDRRVPDRR